MSRECSFKIGDLVEYRAWFDGVGSWIATENLVGVVVDIIAINKEDINYIFTDDDPLYDVKVYWITEGDIETMPDVLLDHYGAEKEFLK